MTHVRKYTIVLAAIIVAGFLWKACSKEELPLPGVTNTPSVARATTPHAEDYKVSVEAEDYKLIIKIDQSAAAVDVSHVIIQPRDCDGKYLSNSNVVSTTPEITYNTGIGNCNFTNGEPFIKFPNMSSFNGQDFVTITIVFNKLVNSADLMLKAGNDCFTYALQVPVDCNHPPGGQLLNAYGYGSAQATCFTTLGFDTWGWTNGPYSEGDFAMNLVANADGCDAGKGIIVGKVSVEYHYGSAKVTYSVLTPYELKETHLYVGKQNLYNGAPAPALSPLNGTSATYTVNGLTGSIYVIANAMVVRP